jgi:membrane protease YdiL (CAAX protease family)
VDKDILNPNLSQKRQLIFSAWLSILLVSDLPDIISHAIFGQVPAWLFGAKTSFLVLFSGLCLLWKHLRPLRPYAFVMVVFYAALLVSEWIGTSAWWVGLADGTQSSFTLAYLKLYIRDTGVAVAVIATLWIVKRRRSEFFLVRGHLTAPIEPIRWLGIREGESWRTFGWIFAFVAALCVAVPTLLTVSPSSTVLLRAVPLIPACFLFAGINAFNEEVYYRTSLLATLPQVIGRTHAMLMNVVFFGLAHYLYGSPPGVIGFLMTGFLAWLLGKSILETKGLFWAWFIHFLPDVVIFFSYALAWGA